MPFLILLFKLRDVNNFQVFFSHTVILFHSSTMQFVILSYMKQLGVKVKESRGLEHKPKLMNLFPKIKVQTLSKLPDSVSK